MSSRTACVAWSSCSRDDQFERGVRSCVDVAVGCSVETLEIEAEGGGIKHGNSRWWWQQTDFRRRSRTNLQTSGGWMEQNYFDHFDGWRLQAAGYRKNQRIPTRHWKQMRNIIRTVRPKNFKLATPMEHEDPYHWQAPWSTRLNVKVSRSRRMSDRTVVGPLVENEKSHKHQHWQEGGPPNLQ